MPKTKMNCEEEAKFMQERIQETEKKLTDLCDVFSQYALLAAKFRDKNDKLGKIALEIAHTEKINKSLSTSFEKFGESMLELGDFGDLRAKTVESKIVQELSKYGELCKKIKKDTVEIFDAKDKEYQRKRQFERMRERGTVGRQQMLQAEQEMVKASTELTKTVCSVEKKMEKFEKEKVHDVKSILMDFIATEMGYHARSLEILSKAFGEVNKTDEVADQEDFKKFLRQFSITPEPSPSAETRTNFFRPSQSLASLAAIFSNTRRKRGPGIPHSKLMDKTVIDSKRGIDSGSSTSTEDEESDNIDSQETEEQDSDYYLKSVEDVSSKMSSDREKSIVESPVLVQKIKGKKF